MRGDHPPEPERVASRKQLGFDPQISEKPPEFDFEKRWRHLEGVLEHEREFWPVEHRHELRVRIVGLLSGWNNDDKRRSILEEVTVPKTIDITVERVQPDECVASEQTDTLSGAKTLAYRHRLKPRSLSLTRKTDEQEIRHPEI